MNVWLTLRSNATSLWAAGTSATVSLTFPGTGYGVPVTVTVPPADQVTSITNASQLANGKGWRPLLCPVVLGRQPLK